MSADNGTYILKTSGPEFRVVQEQAIENIYGPMADNGLWTPNLEMIVEYFGKSIIYTSLEEAWDAAAFMDEQSWTEYGTCLLTDFDEYKFSDFEEQYAKRQNG